MKFEEKAFNQYPLLQTALNDLIAGLSNIAKLHSLIIFDMASEAEYWQAKSKSEKVKLSRDRQSAEAIYRHLKPAADATQRLQLQCDSRSQCEGSGDLFGFLGLFTDTLESTVLDSLDDVWRINEKSAFTPYPEPRMRSLMEAITGWICRILILYLDTPSDGSEVSVIWSRPFKQVQTQLDLAIQLSEKWENSCKFFIGNLWTREDFHRWEGGLPSFANFKNFRKRLKEILEIRSVYAKLVKLFDPKERERLGLEQGLDEFLRKSLPTSSTKTSLRNNAFYQFIYNPLVHSCLNVDHWHAAVSLFNERIRAAEVSAAPHLHLSMSSIVQNCSYRNRNCRATREDWGAGACLAFDPSGSLLHLSTTDGRLRVGYPDGLVQLQREVRLLSGLGYSVPQRLHEVAAQAEVLCRHAIVLKQVAHFYNSIDSEMLPCQQALMLKSALAFERLIKFNHQKSKGDDRSPGSGDQTCCITWSQTDQIPAFIAQLQTAARNLMEENRQLRKVHQELVSKPPKEEIKLCVLQVVTLMEMDLLREPGKWRAGLAWMRCRLTEVANAGGYPADHMRPWLAHLDRQLYKALSVQYRLGLEVLHQRMPEMRVELVYQHSQLAFQPPLEEIKAKYYREIRKFIGIPLHFGGVSNYQNKKFATEASRVFPLIIEKHLSEFRVCYHRAEILFTRLQAVMDLFLTWIALGSVNLEDLVDVQCRDLADYENNFRALKRRGRTADELPNEVKIDCLTVNCVPVKNAIEQLLQNLFEALLNCLKRSVKADLVTADAFLSDALEKLSVRPQTMKEMASARDGHNALTREQSRLADRLASVEQKDKLLLHVSGCGVGAFSNIRSKWAKFQLMMDSFRLMMDKQLNVMQSNLDSRIKAFVGQLERFSTRWQHARPSTNLLESGDRRQCLVAVETIKSWKGEFSEMEKTLDEISKDCAYFKMPLPNLNLVEELRSSLVEAETMWSPYEKFSLELCDLEKEEWISFGFA
ncbi:Cytoplasmic dynein 2 heavy chain 1 [Taenia crassiceps]|uniref:Cytoplasmic dynein 2 heavy chain 1 n=1 Tax=Taenia crassiceps TaxID=6207 RepID=A0ABR4QKA5_9CEST